MKPAKKMPLTNMTLEEIETAPSLTDWERLMNMDDAVIARAAKSDPDALPLGDTFFETARRLPPKLLLKGSKQQITGLTHINWKKSGEGISLNFKDFLLYQ
jgi:hypothetical protein